MKKFALTAVFALTLGVCSIAMAESFVDVPEGHWAADAVQQIKDAGLVIGYPEGTYKGSNPMTRYEYAMIVQRMVDWIDKNYCAKGGDCGGVVDTSKLATKDDLIKLKDGMLSQADLDKVKGIVDKLAAEFKDELAALKAQVAQNTKDIDALNKKVDNIPGANVKITGFVRQRIDLVDSDLTNTQLPTVINVLHGIAGVTSLNAGYEMLPQIQFDDNRKSDNMDWSVALIRQIANQAVVSETTDVSELSIKHAWVSLDFAGEQGVKELDAFKITSGYQPVVFGPYGALVDNQGVDSSVGVRLDIGKDIVNVAAFGGLASATGNAVSGLGTTAKDPYSAARVSLDLNAIKTKLGFNMLITGVQKEKGWGIDIDTKLLENSPFLKGFRGEYLKLSDTETGVDPTTVTVNTVGAARKARDYSYIVGLDVYKTKAAGLTVSYADIPVVPTLTGVDITPLAEYDTNCPGIGLDIKPTNCINREGGRDIFPAGFKGLGVEASYIVLGNVELKGSAVLGDFAGGAFPATWYNPGGDARGTKYPGYGKLSVTKPINANSKFSVEYLQQGKDPIMFNRVRGELLITF